MTLAKDDAVQIVVPEEEGAEARLSLGARASLQAVYDTATGPDLFRRVLSGSVSWQRRNGTTVEEAVRSPHLAPQWVAALLAMDARVAFQEEGQERMLAEFLGRAELHRRRLAAVHLSQDVLRYAWGESHVARTPADEPTVAAIAVIDFSLAGGAIRRARLALTGVWREPARLAESAELLMGETLSDDHIRQVVAAVEREVAPRDDSRGSADYRRAIAGVLTRRALEECRKGASGT